MTLITPNTHAIWDPAWATASVGHSYGKQIELGRELTRYGADLLLRTLQSAPDDLPNHVILTVLFRDAIAALDGVILALEAGAVGGAHIHTRGQMEARWGLMFALKDPAKWGRHLYVSSRREQRVWAARLVPGTPEYTASEEARDLIEAGGGVGARPEFADYIKALDLDLAKPINAPISESFELYEKKTKRSAKWYYDSKDARPIKSIGGLARAVRCGAEYQTMYRHSSHYVHGAFTGNSFKYDDAGAAVAPIRTPEHWRHLFLFGASLASDTFRRVIDHYRPDEVETFRRQYTERWRDIIRNAPDVEVVLNRAVNR